jgi:putative flippase GtrA
MDKLIRQFTGFSVVGVLVSLFSIGLLWVFTNLIQANVYLSYLIVYLISIGLSYMINGRLIFRSELGVKTYILYYGIYLSGMGLGMLIILTVKSFHVFSDFINALFAAPFTLVWNFILVRHLFSGTKNKIHENGS